MRPHSVLAQSLIVLALATGAAHAQEMSAEVRTWTGQSWRLSQPVIQLRYTIVESAGPTPPPAAEGAAPPPPGMFPAVAGGTQLIGGPPGQEPRSRTARRESDVVTIEKDGVATRVPLALIDTLVFMRQPVLGSTLPPYFAPQHVRYLATAVLKDGSRVEGDYVSLGTAVLSGVAPQGRVEVPWEQIETIRFRR